MDGMSPSLIEINRDMNGRTGTMLRTLTSTSQFLDKLKRIIRVLWCYFNDDSDWLMPLYAILSIERWGRNV